MNKLVDQVLELPEGFTPSRGFCPEEAKGKRVRVILRGTMREPRYANETRPDIPLGWSADGRFGCRWSLDDKRFPREMDIVGYRVL